MKEWFNARIGSTVAVHLLGEERPEIYTVAGTGKDFVFLKTEKFGFPLNVPFTAIKSFRLPVA